MRKAEPSTTAEVLGLLPQLLREDEQDTIERGWCLANEELLTFMQARSWITLHVSRQARLANGDVMSSKIDASQPSTENRWGLVIYDDSNSYYMCVIEVLYYAKISVRSAGCIGFEPELCREFNVPDPDLTRVHCPLRVAVGKMWLACACDTAKGALGCREAYEPSSGLPPDMVGVRNMSQDGPTVQGSGSDVLASGSRSRYYGVCAVNLEAVCCQVGRTVPHPSDPVHCFLVCSTKSGKT